MSEKLKNPTGLSLTRTSKYKWTLTWKQGNNYTDQQVKVILRYGGNNWSTGAIKINKNKKSYVYELDYEAFAPYPNGRVLKKITIAVRGKFGGKWTDWKEKNIEYEAPRIGVGKVKYLTIGFSLVQKNKGTFSFSYSGETRACTRIQYQSRLVENCPDDIKSETLWKNLDVDTFTNDMSGSITKAESIIGGSHTRIFRARPCSFAGSSSEWVYASHVYAAPYPAKNVAGNVTLNKDANTLSLSMTWETPSDKRHPIDEVIPQYRIDIPEEGMVCPDDENWSSRPAMADTGGGEGDVFTIDGTIGYDKCVFLRVLTKHDGDNEVSHSLPVMASGDSMGALKTPTITSVTTGTNAVTIVAENTSDVEDSYLMMYYEDKNGNLVSLGRQTVDNIYPIPNLADKIPIIAGAQAVVDGYSMKSAMAYSAGNVPLAPSTLSVNQSTTVKNTVVVSWTWNWSEASACEISWSDHEDAWQSTDEPDTHIVTKMNQSMLSISGVEAGVPLYVRARFIKGSDDNAIYSPYSDIESITISSVPKVPELSVNKDIFVKGESIVCSWTYESGDDTEQIEAIVAEYANSSYVELGRTGKDQSLTLENNFTTGTQHQLAVQVCSGSKRWSAWSALYVITIADELTCTISQHNLTWEKHEINPEEYDGSFVTFDGGDEDNIKDISKMSVALEPHQSGTPWQSLLQTKPYLFHACPDLGHSYNSVLTKLVGASAVVNQLFNASPRTHSSGVVETVADDGHAILNGTASSSDSAMNLNLNSRVPIIAGHKYLIYEGTGKTIKLGINNTASPTITAPTNDGLSYVSTPIESGTTYTDYNVYANIIDLTAYFGSTAIADRAYALEQSQAGSGIAWLKSYGFSTKPYYPYNAGTLQSVKTSKHINTGFNQLAYAPDYMSNQEYAINNCTKLIGGYIYEYNFDGIGTATNWRPILKIYDLNGVNTGANCTSYLRANYFSVYTASTYGNGAYMRGANTSEKSFLIEARQDCYVRFGFLSGNTSSSMTMVNPCVHFHGSRDGEYEPYVKHEYDLPDTELMGLYKLDANNNIYADGDTQTSEGERKHNYGSIDLGTLDWIYVAGDGVFCALLTDAYTGKTSNYDIICEKYVTGYTSIYLLKSYQQSGIMSVVITDPSYTDAATFKTAMNGVHLIYPLATPTTESSDPFQSPQVVDNWGTEEFVDGRAVELPVGNNSTYADIYEITGASDVDVHVRGINQWDEEWELGYYGTDGPHDSNASIRSKNYIPVVSGLTYYFKTASANMYVIRYDADLNVIDGSNGRIAINDSSLTMPSNAVYVRFNMGSAYGATYNHDISINYPSTDHDYHAYVGDDYTADLGTTVYGGEVDIVSGLLTVDKGCISSYNGETIDEPWLSSYDAYTQGETPTTGAQVVYPLSDPLVYQLTAQEVSALAGTNYAWSNEGDITVRIADAIEEGYALKSLPLEVTVTGGGKKTLSIVRDEPYRIERPDGEDFKGYKDQIIYSNTYEDSNKKQIDLPTHFDDGAHYSIKANAIDNWKQEAKAEPVPFIVRWNKQAVFADGEVTISNGVASIEVLALEGSHEDDYVDIYRLSVDGAELIYTGAHYNEVIVDPYPTIGENGGYLLVCNTVYGDGITEDGKQAWTYLEAPFESNDDIIDFNGERIYLKYNVDRSSSWDKDSKVTKYLGGNVVIDYKKGVLRSGSVGTVTVPLAQEDILSAMRRLLSYQDSVHIRTRDGSSYNCDVQGSEDIPHDKYLEVLTYSLSINACKTDTLDGMTLEEYTNGLE